MLMPRCAYRLLLRQQNADQRLTPIGRRIGLVSDKRWRVFEEKKAMLEKAGRFSGEVGGSEVRDRLRTPNTSLADFFEPLPELADLPEEVRAEIEFLRPSTAVLSSGRRERRSAAPVRGEEDPARAQRVSSARPLEGGERQFREVCSADHREGP